MELIQQFPQVASYTLAGNDQAILMIHGFTSTPDVFRKLAHHFSSHFGWEIQVPLLPGHGLTPEQLNQVTFQDWVKACEKEFLKLSEKFSTVHLVGLSMGGTLCAHLATQHPTRIKSLTLLSPALYLRSFWQRFVFPLIRLLPDSFLNTWMVGKKNPDITEYFSYHTYSVKAVKEMDSLFRLVKKEFKTTIPCLVIVPINDKTIHPKSGKWFFNHSSNPKSKLIMLENSPHVLFLGKENERIFSEIENFIKTI